MAAQSTRNLLKMKIHPADRGRRAKGSEKGLVPGWFSPQQWRELLDRRLTHCFNAQPHPTGGGHCRTNAAELSDVAFGVFDSAERVALRRALS